MSHHIYQVGHRDLMGGVSTPADESPSDPGRPDPLGRTASTGQRRFSRRQILVAAAAGVAVVGAGGVALRSGLGEEPSTPLYLRCLFGAYADNAPYPDVYPHYGLESLLRAHLRQMSWFQDMGADWLDQQSQDAAQSGHDLMIAWDPVSGNQRIKFGEILAGQWDNHVTAFFRKAANYPGVVTLRPFWEMNSSGSPYSVDYSGGERQVESTEHFIATWRHLVKLQRAVGGTRIRWMFCANGSDTGAVPVEAYWPGAEYVDDVGFDTYNDERRSWTSFDDLVAPMYSRLEKLAPGLSVHLGEIGCKEAGAPAGHSKGLWVREMFQTRSFPRLASVSFFNADKGVDYRLDSSADSLAVHRWFLQRAPGGSWG